MIRFIACLSLMVLIGPQLVHAQLSAGVARADLTPPIGGPMYGYGARGSNVSQGVHDALYGKVIVLNDQREKLKKEGVQFDPDEGSGIPTTTTDYTPRTVDDARAATGARAADYQVDIDVRGLPQGPTRRTKAGLPEYPIQGDITPDKGLLSENHLMKLREKKRRITQKNQA